MLERLETDLYPMPVPRLARILVEPELRFEILEHPQIIQRMHVAGDELAQGPYAGSRRGRRRQERRLRACLFQIFDDGHRLRQHLTVVQAQCGHETLAVELQKFRLPLLAAAQMNWYGGHLETLQIERDAHAVRGGTQRIAVENHTTEPPPLNSPARIVAALINSDMSTPTATNSAPSAKYSRARR